jgi:Glycolipid 2-alpha-mannosyltransferase
MSFLGRSAGQLTAETEERAGLDVRFTNATLVYWTFRQTSWLLFDHEQRDYAAMEKSVNISSINTLHRNNTAACIACRSSQNAIVYLAQKSKHSSYGHSQPYANLIRSLELLNRNYLSLRSSHSSTTPSRRHCENVDVYVFHTGDLSQDDLYQLKALVSCSSLRLVDLSQSPYWTMPSSMAKDDPSQWYESGRFSLGYRLMIQWYAVNIWAFFSDLNYECMKCNCTSDSGSLVHHRPYRYIWRMDDDSFLHSTIDYDMFDFMDKHGYVYGYRMCSYEMAKSQRAWKVWMDRQQAAQSRQNSSSSSVQALAAATDWQPQRDLDHDMCGFYNNFMVARLDFFLSSPVQDFLRMVQRVGLIFRKLLGDLIIHSMVVYMFAEAGTVHRFLDFTYEHASYHYFDSSADTNSQSSTESTSVNAAVVSATANTGSTLSGSVVESERCLIWGGMQAGYNDPHASVTVSQFCRYHLDHSICPEHPVLTKLGYDDLSPTYNHLTSKQSRRVQLETCVAGGVEIKGKGKLSG